MVGPRADFCRCCWWDWWFCLRSEADLHIVVGEGARLKCRERHRRKTASMKVSLVCD